MSIVPKTFKTDHIVRDVQGVPLGRIILRNEEDYTEGLPLNVVCLTVAEGVTLNVKSLDYYIDGFCYRIPENISSRRIMLVGGKHRVNSFTMEIVD